MINPVLLNLVANATQLPMKVTPITTNAAEIMVWLMENKHTKSSNAELAVQAASADKMYPSRLIQAPRLMFERLPFY
jgi:hypothetical protein